MLENEENKTSLGEEIPETTVENTPSKLQETENETSSKNLPQEKKRGFWSRLLFPDYLYKKSIGKKIAYIAAFTAFCVIANTFFEFKLMDTQFSVTIAVSALMGLLLGPVLGFCACFLGDLIGFLANTGGFMYMPWVGIALGLTAFLSGFTVAALPFRFKGGLYVKLAVACILSFTVSTVLVNTTAFWLLYAKGVHYWTYLFTRLFVRGQIYNCIFNYALIYALVPLLNGIKPLKIKIS
ncbi:MAG: ECF transporter S component [Clostridia bacterium]|nr:ECF transporter S component [Clostridia bacterium]